MSEEIKASKKVQHAIRMLDWHTDKVKRKKLMKIN